MYFPSKWKFEHFYIVFWNIYGKFGQFQTRENFNSSRDEIQAFMRKMLEVRQTVSHASFSTKTSQSYLFNYVDGSCVFIGSLGFTQTQNIRSMLTVQTVWHSIKFYFFKPTTESDSEVGALKLLSAVQNGWGKLGRSCGKYNTKFYACNKGSFCLCTYWLLGTIKESCQTALTDWTAEMMVGHFCHFHIFVQPFSLIT